MRKRPNSVIHVRFPVFGNYTVKVELTDSVVETVAQYDPDLDMRDTAAVTLHNNGSKCAIIIPRGANIDVITHEASHAIDKLFDYTAVEPCSETRAYHLGYLVHQIARLIERD